MIEMMDERTASAVWWVYPETGRAVPFDSAGLALGYARALAGSGVPCRVVEVSAVCRSYRPSPKR